MSGGRGLWTDGPLLLASNIDLIEKRQGHMGEGAGMSSKLMPNYHTSSGEGGLTSKYWWPHILNGYHWSRVSDEIGSDNRAEAVKNIKELRWNNRGQMQKGKWWTPGGERRGTFLVGTSSPVGDESRISRRCCPYFSRWWPVSSRGSKGNVNWINISCIFMLVRISCLINYW